jgi:Na+/proline symporter
MRRLSYAFIVLTALLGAVGAIFSPKFLQAIVVFAGGSAGCAFLVPCVMATLWPRATREGALAAMLGGVLTMLGLYAAGWITGADPGIGEKGNFYPVYPLGIAPFVWGLIASAVLGIGVSLATATPRREVVDRFFGTGDAAPEA